MKRLLQLLIWCSLLLGVQHLSSQTLDDFPGVQSVIDQNNCCMNQEVIFFDGDVQFFYVANNPDCFGPGGRLLLVDGTVYCEDGGTDCRQFYGLTGGQSIFSCSASSEVDLFALFPFLSSIVDVNNCQGEVIEYFRNQDNNEFLCVVEENTRTWYYPNGVIACISDGSFDCPTAYGFGDMELIEIFICDGTGGGGDGDGDGDGGNVADAVGAVYAMTNGQGQVDGIVQGPNAVVAYAQAADGTLTEIGSFATGGNGGDFDGGEGLDPLISAYALTKTNDNRFVLAVNAGSNSVTAMQVNSDFSLSVTDTESTQDIGPNSIAYVPSQTPGVNGIVYVSNITRQEFLALGEPGHQGSIVGYLLMDDGSLEPIANSRRELANRPSAVQISADGNWLVVASINAGASGLGSANEDEIVLYSLTASGELSASQLDGSTSTLRGNSAGRNLPSAIGFQIVQDNYVVVTEAREFQPDGAPPAFPALQDGSVSTWQISTDGMLIPVDLDVPSGTNNTGRTACWLDFSDDNTFFVSNAIEAGLASYSFNNGDIELLDQVAAQGTGATGNTTDPGLAFSTTEGWIDMWISDDGQFLYQLFGLSGEVGVYAINGTELTLLQEIGGLPANNTQGIVSVGQPSDGDGDMAGGGDPDDTICDVDGGVLSGGPFEFCVGDDIADMIGSDEIALSGGRTGPAVSVQFEFEVLQPADGFFVTEPWVGLHNGSFDLFNFGERATPGLESLAEGGNTELLGSEFAQAGRLQATVGNGEVQFISPGETISGSIDIRNPLNYRYASFATMIIPSNDGFFGNEDPLEFEIFDENGNFNGPIEIVLTGADLWDAGTEVNNASGAAGFSQGFDGSGSGPSTDDPSSTVGEHPGLDNIIGIQTAAGTTIGSNGGGALGANEEILRVRITVGEPINTVQAVGPPFEGSVVEEAPADDTGLATAVQFEFEVIQPTDGFFVTEPWVGLHDGSFDLFNFGERATPGLESLAEGGNTELLGSEFAQAGRLQATVGNGEVQFISPGETISGSIDIRNPLNYRYASFATMIIPSNDGFFGNENPLEFEVFDENGNFNGPIEIVLTGADLWDAGTEVNNASGAAGFSQGFDGSGSGPSTDDPSSTIGEHPGLENIIGIQTAAGTTIGSNGGGALDPDEPILRVRITVGQPINTVQAVGPPFEGSVVEEEDTDDDSMAAVQFEFEVMQPTDGFFVTEPWVGLHDGSFDLFNFGERATPGLESLAEGGNTELLGSEFAQAGRLQSTVGNGQVQFISPGETISGSIDVRNPLNYRYASFATMIIPSNDGFFGNENPLEFEIFDENGNFNGPIEVVLTGADLWDAGTEVNNASGAAGFSQGFDGSGSGPSTDDPSSTVSEHPGLDNIIGLQTAAGTTIGSNGGGPLDADEPILRVRITLGEPINTVQAVGPLFEGSVVTPSEGWIVADAASGEIMGLPANISDFDFNSLSTGVSSVFYYASSGDITGLEVGGNINNITGCFDLSNPVEVNRVSCADAVGAVYAMTNGQGQVDGIVQGPNSVVAYAQAADGTLTELGSFPTGGNGGDFDGGEGLDPLISAYAITKSLDNRFVLAVNAGSNSVTSMRVNEDFSLEVVDTESTLDFGPNSIAYSPRDIDGVNGLIYVSNITQEEFLDLGEPGHQGSLVGCLLYTSPSPRD